MTFDWRAPDYVSVYAARAERLARIREHPEQLVGLREYYAAHPADFISDWGLTSDPRNRNRGLPTEIPFVLFGRQREMIEFVVDRMRAREPGVIEKSRDCGASWLAMSLAVTLCLLGQGVVIGVGSSKEDKVDRSGDPDSLLWKARFFLKSLPPEFRGSWDETKHTAHMRVMFPETGSAIVGEAGDSIGRGGRSTAYFIDEAAFLERPQLIEQSLAGNTPVRIDISTPNGRANAFAVKRWSGSVQVFTFHWREDPRKDDAWYRRQCELLDPVTRAQEIDLSYDASVEGILIPAEWVQAAIGAHTKLGIEVSGARRGALDVADEGRDKNAFAGRHGILLEHLESWSGKNGDIYKTTVRAMGVCEQHGYPGFDYDADGLGAGVRGDAVDINVKRREAGKSEIEAEQFRGSGAVYDPDGSMVEGRLNRDYFANLKAQSWWALRLRFQNTFRAVVEDMPYSADDIISIDLQPPELTALVTELSQPTYSVNSVGKIVVDKAPDGAMSPNLADAVMIAFSPGHLGAYFGVATSAAGAGAQPQQLQMDAVYVALFFAGGAVAAVFCGVNSPGLVAAGHPGLVIIDWDVREVDAGVVPWVRTIGARLRTLTPRLPDRRCVFIDDFAEGYAEMLRQRGLKAVEIGEELPPIPERANRARPYLNTGLVLIGPAARDRVVTFRSSSRNHLRDLLGRPELPADDALALALATAVLLAYAGALVLPEPPGEPEAPPAEPPLPPPPRRPVPGISLVLGSHEIDGQRVLVERNPEHPHWPDNRVPLSPGRHTVDGKVIVVHAPGAGIRVMV